MEFEGHKILENGFYSVRGNLIDLKDIASIEPEYHNNNRSIYLKINKKSSGKNIIKMKNHREYEYLEKMFNEVLNTSL